MFKKLLDAANKRALAYTGVIISLFSPILADATAIDFKTIPCSIIKDVNNVVEVIGPTFVFLMFLYGGAKYVFSADNPGGRNQGRNICIHALIGGILIGLWVAIKSLVIPSWGSSC